MGWSCTFTLYLLDTPEDAEDVGYREINPFSDDYSEHIYYSLQGLDGPQLDNMLSSLSEVVNFSVIETLQISSALHDAYSTVFWETALKRLPNLTTLYFVNMPCTTALFCLEPGNNPEGFAQVEVVLPRLRYLWLDLLDIRETSEQAGTLGPDRSQFLRILSSRLRAKRQFERLRIDTLLMEDPTQANRSFIPRLRALVPQVDVHRVQERDPDTGTSTVCIPVRSPLADAVS